MDRKIISKKELKLHNKGYNFLWLMQMAWRDSRKSRSRLFLFISSIILGIAALVAIYSLGNNLNDEVDSQAASLLGADLEVSGSNPTTPAIQKIVDSLGGKRSAQQSFASMVLFTKSGGTRLTEVRALQGAFPYYGSLETLPASAGRSFRNKQQALVDETLMLQYSAHIGDSIKVGNVNFAIAGKLLNAPGQTGLSASVAPIVYIPLQYMTQTGLAQKGSRISYRYYFKYNSQTDVEKLVDMLKLRLEANDLRYDTVESQKEDTGHAFSDLTKFLSLVGFIALLLGCTGVASAVHVYVKEKVNSIAILRCLGVKSSQAFIIYLIQIISIGFIGSLIGAGLGVIIQQFLPFVIKDFLPVKINTHISWPVVLQGMVLGIIVSVLFALLPLLSIRRISPLNALRVSVEPSRGERDIVKWLIYLLIILFVYGFTLVQMNNWVQAVYFTGSIAAALLILTAIARGLMWMVRHFFPSSWNYLWRQGLANLYRPNNQTTILIISIGLGTALICTLFFVQSLLVSRITLNAGENQPNIVLFDIQTKQEDSVIALARKFGLPANGTVPIVSMRLEDVNGITGAQAKRDSTKGFSRWLFSREYRVTYRDSLTASEKISNGKWTGVANGISIPAVSLEKNFAKRSGVHMGDTLTFNVQGTLMKTIVGSLREVNWGGIQTNFLVVFPKGLLEDAPQFKVLLSKVPSQQVSANFQQAMVKAYPNVSIIDLNLVLHILDDLMSKISFVIRFMAGFSIVTGIVVLISSVLISKYQRLQESVLLRTLGGSRKQIFAITALEYFFLGALAAFTGILLALAASWGLAYYIFEIPFHPAMLPVLILFVLVCLLTIFTGLANSRGILNRSPLEVLRVEGKYVADHILNLSRSVSTNSFLFFLINFNMLMKKIYVLILLFSFLQSHAQSKRAYWSIGVNPLGIIEVIPAIGPSASYRISPRLEVWSEASYLFGGPNKISNWKNLQGYRFIFQTRYYTNKSKTFFIAPEFRLKHYSYNATGSFVNAGNSDTLNSYPYKASQILTGSAFVLGRQVTLSKSHQLYLEITAGIGSKLRRIKRNNIPAGYQYDYYRRKAFSTGYDDDNRSDPYVPLGFRLMWKLNK